MPGVPVFHGRVDGNARLVLEPREALMRRTYLRTLVNRNVELILRRERVKRSLDQNAYLHAQPFPLLAEHFGDSVEGVKHDLMGECWGWKTSPITGLQVPVKPNTSDMTVDECTFFIDWLIPWALTQHGVDIPWPEKADV